MIYVYLHLERSKSKMNEDGVILATAGRLRRWANEIIKRMTDQDREEPPVVDSAGTVLLDEVH